jgi:signal peptidase I
LKKHWKAGIAGFRRGWWFSFLVALLVATSFKSAIADWNVVPTGSMKPSILEGDRIFVNKLAYDLKFPYTTWHLVEWRFPKRGEVVVFNSPADGQRLVKRVVGVPGDSIEMRKNRLKINGETIRYEPIKDRDKYDMSFCAESSRFCVYENLDGARHPVMITPDRLAMRSFGPVTLPEGKYFVMGDNRDDSADSRYFGFVDRSSVVGKATSIVISLDIHDRYRPRWGRFFTDLP